MTVDLDEGGECWHGGRNYFLRG